MFLWKLIVLLAFEVATIKSQRRGWHGGNRHHGHGFNNNWNGNHGNHWGPQQGNFNNGLAWGQPDNSQNWGYNNQQGNNGNNPSWQWGQNQQIEPAKCPRPSFEDNAQVIIDICSQERHHEECWDSSKEIPIGWTVTINCHKGSSIIQYKSTCSPSGTWNPQMHQSCEPIIKQSLSDVLPLSHFGNPHHHNHPKFPLTNAPHTNAPLSPTASSHRPNNNAGHHANSNSPQCPMLHMKLSVNFIFNCLFPDEEVETENCLSFEKVSSGTVAMLKCKPPFYSQEDTLSEWVCEEGHWKGDFHQKLKCYQSLSSPHNHRPAPTRRPTSTSTTTEKPKTVLTHPQTTIKPLPVLTNPPEEWSPPTTSVVATKIPQQITSTSTTTKQPWTQVITTSTNTPSKPSSSGCPPLFPRSSGIVLECVSSVSGSVTLNACDVFQPVGSEAKYSCKDYYESTAGLVTLYRKCREDGTWTGSADSFNCVVQCGRNNVIIVPFITSGLPSFRGQWPWHSALFLRETFSDVSTNKWTYICGGTLISRNAVATAAHCVTLFQSSKARNVSNLRIDLGRFQREKPDDIIQAKDVSSIHAHPSYSPFGYDSDIAVIILRDEVQIGYHVRPICFPQTLSSALEELQVSENSLGTVVGWGYNERSELADELQMAQLQVASQQACSDSFGGSGIALQAKSTTYCAGFKNGTKFVNVCNGDSGGGMYFPLKNSDFTRWYLQGIVSLGIADEDRKCKPSSYSIFTRVGRYSDWIVRVLSENDAL